MATEIDRLVVKIDADIAAMEQKLNKVIGQNRNAAKQVKDAWGGGGNVFSAMEKGFEDLARSAGLAASSIPGVGVALRALGPEGLAVTAALGGFIAALDQAKEAVAWSAELQKTADGLHITTDALQTFQGALHAAGGDQTQVAAAMQNFNEILGKASDGVPKALKVFQELFGKGFTKEDVARLGDAGTALAVVNKEIQGLSKTQQEAIISQFGLSGMKDLLELTPEKFREAQVEAGKLGQIMDASVVAKGKALNDELDKSFKTIGVSWRTALTDLAPILEGLVALFAQITTSTMRTLDGMRAIKNQRLDTLKQELADASQRDFSASRFGPTGVGGQGGRTKGSPQYIAQLKQTIAERELEAANDARTSGLTDVVTKRLTDVTKQPKVHDETGALDKAAQDAYAQSLKELQTAQAALATSIGERAVLEKGAVDADLSKKLVDLDAQEAAIHKAANEGKLNQHQADQLSYIRMARLNDQQAALDQKRLIDQQAAISLVEANNAHLQAVAALNAASLNAQAAVLTGQAQLAGSIRERAELDRKALALSQQAERELADAKVAQAEATVLTAIFEKQRAEVIKADVDAMNAARQARALLPGQQATASAAQARADESPIQAYQRQIQSLSDTMETIGVDAAKSLSDGLVDAAINAKSLGDVASNVFKQLIAQIASAALQKNFFAPILASLGFPAHAQGTLSSAAGWALVGENGPEAVRLPGNSQVISNQTLRNVGLGSGGGGAAPTFVFDNRGAVIWEQAARQMMAYADRAAMGAGSMAIGVSRRTTPNDLARASSRRL